MSENLHRCKCGGEFLTWTVLFIHIISCCSGGGSIKQGSPDTYPSKTSGSSSKQESSDTDPSQTPGKLIRSKID